MEWTLEDVDPGELPPGHHGRPPKVKVLEIVAQGDNTMPTVVTAGQYLLVRVAYTTPAAQSPQNDFTATAVIQGSVWETARVPLSLHLAGVMASFTAPPLVIVQGQQASTPILVRSIAGPHAEVSFEMSRTQLHTGISLLPNLLELDSGQAVPELLTFAAEADAPLGENTLAIDQLAFNQRHGLLLAVEVLAPAPAPTPDPRVDHFDAVYVDGSTKRICQLTGGGDPEGKPHPNDTTRFALLGTDLGSSFDHLVDGERRTYFFFGDTHTGEGDQDGDAIAFTTDDRPEPDGIHLQFMMGDRQWRRLVIPGISLGNFEVPTGGFSHAGRIFVFATTGILRTGDPPFMENSVLASAVDAHDNFDLAYFASSRDDNVDTAFTGGKFINVAPCKLRNDDWPGLPDNALPGGEGLFLAGTGSYRRSNPYLAYVPLRPGETPQKGDWRYLSGFSLWEPGFGPNGPPTWSEAESDCIPLFDDKLGELSYCWNAGLGRWLLAYGGCAPAGCGIVLRSAPRPWGPWSETPQLLFESQREGAQGKYMFECGPYGAYVISRYDEWNPGPQEATIYYTLSNGDCVGDSSEPRYQVHLIKSTLRLVSR